jgi:AcrR family transcriptional regulator
MTKSAAGAKAPRRAREHPADAITKPKGQWHHGDLRSSLIAWGTHILDTEGTGAMSMRAAAKLAGVSQGAPAHHFVDRNGLLAAIAAQGFRDMIELRKERLAPVPAADKRGRLRAVLLGYVEFAMKYPARFHLMFGPDLERRDDYPELVAATAESRALLSSVVLPFMNKNARDQLDETELVFAVWATVHGLATLAIHHGRDPAKCKGQPSTEHLSEVVVQFVLAALSGSSIKVPR